MIYLAILMATFIILSVTLIFINKMPNKTNLHYQFIDFMILLTIPCISLSAQILAQDSNIPKIYFDYFTYIFTLFGPVKLLMAALLYRDNTINIHKYNFWYWISCIFFGFLLTNDYTRLYYQEYSTELSKTSFGIIGNIGTVYCYAILLISMFLLLKASLDKSGFFSKQTVLMILGICIPLVTNVLGILRVININIYLTPTLFAFSATCFSIAIFRYKAFNIVPVALKTVVDIMTDSFVVISNDGTISDYNKNFVKTFGKILNTQEINNFFTMCESNKNFNLEIIKKHINECRVSGSVILEEYHFNDGEKDHYFEVEFQSVKSKYSNEIIGSLILFKDVTVHKKDIETIKQNQDIITKQAQLASIGELAGGVAHDINTPISAIKSGILMLREIHGASSEEEKVLLQRMDNCADKIITIVNSIRNQIRNLGTSQSIRFKISDVINDVKTISYNEMIKHRCELNIRIEDDLQVKGDPSKLGQVITNLVINAVQAYEGKPGKIEVVVIKSPKNMAMIKVIDYAKGINDEIKDHIFKNVLTTKGSTGTGLGLYLAYSVMKVDFSGDISFETIKNQGTVFYLTIPIDKL